MKKKAYNLSMANANQSLTVRSAQDLADYELEHAEVGDVFTVKVIEMTDEEMEALPEWEGW